MFSALEVCEDDSQLRWLYVRASLEELARAWSPLGGDRGGRYEGIQGDTQGLRAYGKEHGSYYLGFRFFGVSEEWNIQWKRKCKMIWNLGRS